MPAFGGCRIRLMPFDWVLLLVVSATFLLAGFVKGVIGLGLPTVAMAMLTVSMSPPRAASLLLVPSFVTNIWQLAAGPSFGPLIRRLWPFLLAVVAGTLLGAWAGIGLMKQNSGHWAEIGLGLALVAYAALGLFSVRFPFAPEAEGWVGPLVGVVTGVVTAATGVFVIPAVLFLGGIGLAKDDLIQALGLSFTVSTVALGLALAGAGTFEGASLAASLLALVPALLGMAFGGWVRGRASEAAFRRCFFLGLLCLGAYLAFAPLLGR